MVIQKFTIFQLVLFRYVYGTENNVCTNLQGYLNMKFSKNCYYNPDVGALPEKLIRNHGYPFENHSITTEDGYVLNLFRIPHNNIDLASVRQPILIHHGILASSTYFLSIRNHSLPFLLSNAGYDVWLANSRGTPYSLDHLHLSAHEKNYWNYSFHEIAIYDLPATIEFIARKSHSKHKIIYIGHSMGTTVSFVYSILKKEHAQKYVSGLIALCPVAYMGHAKGSIVLAAQLRNVIEAVAKLLNIFVIFSPFSPFTEIMFKVASKFPFMLIELFINTLAYGKYDSIKDVRFDALPVHYSMTPSSTGLKLLMHFLQEVGNGGKFQFYDYGKTDNLKQYGSEEPPDYNLAEIGIPVYLFYGENDVSANEKDVEHLYNKLTVKNKLITTVPLTKDSKRRFNHVDFLYGKNVEDLLYYPLIEIIKKKLKGI